MSLQDEKEEVDDEEPIDPKAECPTRNNAPVGGSEIRGENQVKW